ncbi:PorP/SprF family type IX secretion system membrane protein [Muricauda ruestringensis]|uniref:PorP/SprF family type IX secretion system membrane protein n=1 Tax=Flagellimonas ruestringensis TaxID=111501 RepID=UPI001CD4311D|nr:PorP/SprF family type IX secretion system membrane protein [Allomuricauda ruestringensis]MCA0957426.1 PorP/SprF family type IX secretion system membrane protein [Allomuricauda ruestringensis]
MRLFKIHIPVLMLLAFGFVSHAQQTALFPEYNYNPFIINSAYAGMADGAEATLSHYGYLNGIEGNPTTLSFSFHTPVSRDKMALGGAVLQDKIGVTTSTHAFAAYSYKIFFDVKRDRPYWQVYDQNVLSFGITAGIRKYGENLLELGIHDDPEFDENINANIPTVGVGILYNRANFYLGFSVPNILGDQLASRDDLKLVNPFYGYFGYRFFTNNFQEIMIKPSALLKYEAGAPIQIDANIAVNFKNKFEIGTGYRSSNSINFLGGIYALKKLKFVYYYNVGLENSMLGNSHGLVVSFRFSK